MKRRGLFVLSFLLILILGLGLPAQALTAVHESDSHWQFIVLSDGSAAVIGRREIYSLTDSVISIPTLMSENGGTKVYKVSYLMYYYINVGKIQMFYAPNMTEAVIPGMVGTIGDNFFQSCKKLKKVNIPGSVTKIGNSAFINCSALTTVTDCVAVKTVGKSAFNNCTSLRSIPLSNNVTSIGEYAFYNSGLTSFNVPNKVTTLTRGCFKNCKSLTSITIPTSVTTIEDDCFAGCSNINAVYAGSKSQWAKISVGANNGALKVSFQVQETSGSSGGNAGTTTPKKDVCNCSGYGGTYVVKGTDGRLAINSGHGTAASGFVQLGTIPEGAKVTISKASGYYGRGKSSGHWGHVTYNGITGYCAMNYLEKADSVTVTPASSCTTCNGGYAGYYVVRGTNGSLAINSGHGTASSGYTQLGTIPEGTTVYISKATGYSGRGKSSGNWGHVTYNGVSGCCAMNYLDVTDSTDTCSTEWAGYYRVKNTNGSLGLNNGHGYGGSYTQLAAIPEGTIVYVSKAMNYKGQGHSSGYWGHVTYNGISGYSSMNYLEFVSKDVTAPSVGSLSYDNLTVSGFDVHASVSDDTGVSRVQCAVWTDANGQDDLPANWTTASACAASVSGGVATFHVSFSDHGNQKGLYNVQMYAYDATGNFSYKTLAVNVDNTAPVIASAKIQNLTSAGYDVVINATDAGSGVSEIRVATWNSVDGESKKLLDGALFTPAASRSLTLHFNAAKAGKYTTSVTAVDALGNVSAVSKLSAWVEATAPAAKVVRLYDADESGFTVEFSATDDHGLKKIIIYAWTPDNDAEGGGMSGMDQVAEYACTVSGTSDTGTVRVNTANLGGEIDTRFSVYAVAVDRCGNRSAKSATSTLRIAPACTKMKLPASLGAVKDSVFSGMASGYVVVDKKCKSIADNAFANCKSMKYIFIPSSVTSISETAFSGCGGFKILAPIGSYAQTYAREHGIAWIHKDK